MIALAGPIFVVGLVVTKLAINEQKQTDRADEPVLSHTERPYFAGLKERA